MYTSQIDSADLELANELFPCLTLDVIAEKLEVPLFDLAQTMFECDFSMHESLFNFRIKRGLIRLNSDEMEIERYCPHCKLYHPLTKDFWYHSKHNVGGANKRCIACEVERKNASRARLAAKLH